MPVGALPIGPLPVGRLELATPPPASPVTRSEAGGAGSGGVFQVLSPRSTEVAWPQVKCNECKVVGHWRAMELHRVRVHYEAKFGDPDDKFDEVRTCIRCVSVRDDITIDEAKEKVLGSAIDNKRYRAGKFKEAAMKREERIAQGGYEVMDSRRQTRLLTIQFMDELFQPLGKYILRKKAAMEKVAQNVQAHKKLVVELMSAKSMLEEARIIDAMEALEVDDGYIAYVGHADQHAMIMASSYSDSWVLIRNSKGEVIGALDSWYLCLAKTGDWAKMKIEEHQEEVWRRQECLKLHPSKEWRTKFSDPLAKGQKYYCSCWARYNATWGQIVEVRRVNSKGELERMYFRADCPSWDAEDVRASYYEDELPDAKTPAQLYAAMRRVEPTVTEIIHKVADGPGWRVCDLDTYLKIPKFHWSEIFTVAGIPTPKGVK